MSTPRTVAFHTLGCKLNYSETSTIARQFRDEGFALSDYRDTADIYVINTCSVTDFADRKCRKIVRQARRQNPDARIIMIGCYAQLKPDEIAAIPGVDLVLGASEKFNILKYVEELSYAPLDSPVQRSTIQEANTFVDAFSFGDRTRSFLKVQDGCDYKCSFCTIPLARGKSRSDKVGHAVINAQAIADMGVKEIVLTGVNIGDFGKGTEVIEGRRSKNEALFIDLIKSLDQVDGIDRFRISSIEPNLCTDEIIEFVAKSRRFVPHFHMPLQSGNDKQLREMRRRYTSSLYADRVELIRKVMPHACIGVDVIVGFPGETEEDFLTSYQFINDLDISYLHVFTYSERPDTEANDRADHIEMGERKRRNKMLRILSEKKRRHFYAQHIDTCREVLFENHTKDGLMSGFTDNYIRVESPEIPELINTIQEVELKTINSDGLVEVELLGERVGVR